MVFSLSPLLLRYKQLPGLLWLPAEADLKTVFHSDRLQYFSFHVFLISHARDVR